MGDLLRLLHGEELVDGPFRFRLTSTGLHIGDELGPDPADATRTIVQEISVTAARARLAIHTEDPDDRWQRTASATPNRDVRRPAPKA